MFFVLFLLQNSFCDSNHEDLNSVRTQFIISLHMMLRFMKGNTCCSHSSHSLKEKQKVFIYSPHIHLIQVASLFIHSVEPSFWRQQLISDKKRKNLFESKIIGWNKLFFFLLLYLFQRLISYYKCIYFSDILNIWIPSLTFDTNDNLWWQTSISSCRQRKK